jgi:predicted MFS family arabinose efflux permease
METGGATAARHARWIVVSAALLLAIITGSRTSFGLFVSPLNSATGLGLASISLAIAVSQLVAGAAQPVVGALSDRIGTGRIVVAGALLLAAGTAMIPRVDSAAGLMLTLAMMAAAGAAAGSNGLLLGVVARRVPAAQRGLAAGVVGAGGSAGQMLLAPATQGLITAYGWANAMLALAALALLAIPVARPFLHREPTLERTDPAVDDGAQPVHRPLRNPGYWCIAAGFGVCGFHVSFLVTHMPGVIEACGLPGRLAGTWLAIVGLCNIVGSVASGVLIRHVRMKYALSGLYALRAAGVALFVSTPASEASVLAFAVWMGLTYMATLPPTVGLVGKLHGVRNLGALFGIVMMVHQIGAFAGVWLGGWVFETTGSHHLVWAVDIALALSAALIHLPIREPGAGDGPSAAGRSGSPQRSATPTATPTASPARDFHGILGGDRGRTHPPAVARSNLQESTP